MASYAFDSRLERPAWNLVSTANHDALSFSICAPNFNQSINYQPYENIPTCLSACKKLVSKVASNS
eukprot:scaffold539_cov187-Ochromonas_danica.AAC.15